MNEFHRAFLSLGSNIEPEINLVRAVQLLKMYGRVEKISNVWESESVGAEGPHYLNACVLFATAGEQEELKRVVLLPIESQLGRRRTADRYAPRPMDIDIIIFDGKSCDDRYWDQPFVVIPLAEIDPEFQNPLHRETVAETAARLRTGFWMQARPDVSSRLNGSMFPA